MAETTKDALGDRMKAYERKTRLVLPARTYSIARLDGVAFHTFTKGLERPFDPALVRAMGATMKSLCESISNVVLGYCQSDEITLLLTDFQRESTQQWYGGNVQKITSVSAAMAATFFNQHFKHPKSSSIALFDSRVFTVAERHEAANALLWRQQDARRNAISMVGQANFSHRELQGVSTAALREKLKAERGIEVDELPREFLYGQVCYQQKVLKPVEYFDKRTRQTVTTDPVERRIWQLEPAPLFAASPGNWLYDLIPALPVEE